jgi:hypothetical protein
MGSSKHAKLTSPLLRTPLCIKVKPGSSSYKLNHLCQLH